MCGPPVFPKGGPLTDPGSSPRGKEVEHLVVAGGVQGVNIKVKGLPSPLNFLYHCLCDPRPVYEEREAGQSLILVFSRTPKRREGGPTDDRAFSG